MSNFKDVSIRSRIAVIEALVKHSIAEKLNTEPEYVDLGYAYNLNDEALDINIVIISTTQHENSDIITETYGAKVIKSGDQTDIIELAIHIAKRELASENQRYNKIMNSVRTNKHMIDFTMDRRDQLSAIQREQEHEAARKIALMLEPDAKHNSYDLAVAKYKRRTTRNMRLIIQSVLNKKLKVIETKSIL